ncbi:MAG TPA: hypothetical protein VN256_01365 [Pyrinomonadaceae bacterium]|nr:hypothetical protein [Pyrinomonadaceae bacterium]
MFSTHNAASQPSQSPSGEDRKVEVSIESGADGEQVVLRYLTWTEGLGWCGQKTIRLDGEHVDDLHRALTVARHRIGRRRAETGQVSEPAKVIQFPTIA